MGVPIELQVVADQLEIGEAMSSGSMFLSVKFYDKTREASLPAAATTGKGHRRTKKTKKEPTTSFNNQVTFVLSVDNTKVNIKVFRNGSIQMTGVKSLEQGPRVLSIVEAALRRTSGAINDKDLDKLHATSFKVCLINSDFDMHMSVKRDALLRCLRTRYPKVNCSFEPCLYPGVKIKYMWNSDKMVTARGHCCCTVLCCGDGEGNGNGKCRKVTIIIFQSGKAIITGSQSMEQLTSAYRFIVEDVAKYSSEYELLPIDNVLEQLAISN